METNDGFGDQMPQTIGRYQVQESIGYGAMGAVYKAFDPLIKRTIAIKTIRLDIPRQSPQYRSFIDRFYHEARISGTLSHPNIVTLFDIGEEAGLPYLAMEYVEGETIASLLERGQRFKPEKVIGLASQIAAAVDYAHTKGVIHRDIKPSNLILHESEQVKVTDFGIAKLMDAEMTQSGTLLGTPSYMSPEQAMGEKLDGRSDIFALGVCAFEMLSGEQPFPGNNVTSILYKLVHVDPIEPANLEMNGLVPEKWHQVFGKVLAKKPDDRYQTATEFVQDLEYCLGAWFGAAVGDVPLEGTLVDEATRARPVMAEIPDPVTVGMAAVRPDALPSDTVPPELGAVLGRAGQDGSGGIPAPAADAAGEGTVQMTAPTDMPASQAEGTVLMAAVAAAQAEGTVLMSPPSAAPPEAQEGTVVMPLVAPTSEERTVLMSAASSIPPAGQEKTVAMPIPAPAAEEGTVLMAVPAIVTSGGEEGTVLMPGVPASTAAEGTVLMPIQSAPPEPTRRPPAPAPLPQTGPLPRPGAPAPAVAPQLQDSKKGPPLLLLLGGGALVLVLGLAVGIAWFLRQGGAVKPTPAPSSVPVTTAPATPEPAPTAPALTSGMLRVTSVPPGATVSVDGVVKGPTPLEVGDLSLGPHELKAEMKGYEAAQQSVPLTLEAPEATVNLTLNRVAPVTGGLEVASVPAGASVVLNGAAAGHTPYRNRALRPGVYRVQALREGYEPWVADATVQVGKTARLDAVLKALPKATPTPEPRAEAVDPNRVYEDSEVDVKPRKVSGTTASYPPDAPKIRSGEQVSVIVSFTVTETGEVTDIKVVASGGKLVDEAVIATLRASKYNPGTKKGVKVKVRLSTKLSFRAL